jgi:hypothetical protein
MLALGGATGLASGVMGIGAGTMCTVGLAVGGPAEWSHKVVLGTAFAAQLLPHAMGAFTHWQLGNLRMRLVPWLVLGTAAGSALASRVAVNVDQDALRLLFAAYVSALGANSLRAARAMRRRVYQHCRTAVDASLFRSTRAPSVRRVSMEKAEALSGQPQASTTAWSPATHTSCARRFPVVLFPCSAAAVSCFLGTWRSPVRSAWPGAQCTVQQ